MLSKRDIKEIDEAVEKLEVSEIVSMAKKMGITVGPSKRAYHRVKNKNGQYEKLDMDKHFSIDLEKDITLENDYFYSYSNGDKKDMAKYPYVLAV